MTPAGLTVASGEVGTGSQQSTFNAMGLFLGVVTDPNIAGRGTPVVTASFASNADDGRPALASPYSDRWRVWAAGFGSSQSTDGNAAQGSNDQSARIYGIAAGTDDKVSSNVVAGFADAILTLRGRMAWAHNFGTDRSATAVFQALARASFEVNGAAQDANSLLMSSSAELVWQNGFSLGGTFDSEYSDNAQAYSGKGVLKYQW